MAEARIWARCRWYGTAEQQHVALIVLMRYSPCLVFSSAPIPSPFAEFKLRTSDRISAPALY